ncbi:DKNYY domain-containing protein [Candidatus Parcubacteria bacterium]|nr:DKNYY domain-containing protein [Candidatus Parcubacteria bacterium]
MPPTQSESPGIKWHEVTWYSKLGAIILFVGVVPALCFYIGIQYEKVLQSNVFVSAKDVQIPIKNMTSVTNNTWTSSSTGMSLPKGVDSATFTESEYFAKDNHQVYILGCESDCYWVPVAGFDPATFSILISPHGSSTIYAKDKNGVYVWKNSIQNIDDLRVMADPASFAVFLDRQGAPTEYARDKSHLYDEGELFENGDISSFSIVGPVRGYAFFLAKDKNTVYCGSRVVIATADPLTFTQIKFSNGITSSYSKDKAQVYRACTPVPFADPKTFTPIYNVADGYAGEAYAKDKNNVYYRGEVIEDADPATFEGVSERTRSSNNILFEARDKSHLYYAGKQVE